MDQVEHLQQSGLLTHAGEITMHSAGRHPDILDLINRIR